MNMILESVERLNKATDNAELDTILALSDTYAKMFTILEYSDGDVPFFSGIAVPIHDYKKKQPKDPVSLKGKPDESTMKKIIMFIPRLIIIAIRALIKAFSVLHDYMSHLMIDVSYKLAGKSLDEVIVVPFDMEYIDKAMNSVAALIKDVLINANMDHKAIADIYPTIDNWVIPYGILIAMRLKSDKPKTYLETWDEHAYKDHSMSRYEAKQFVKTLSDNVKTLKRMLSDINKMNKPVDPTFDASTIPENCVTATSEFNKLIGEWTKKFSELTQKLSDFGKGMKKAPTIGSRSDFES